MALGAVERDAEENSGVMLSMGMGRTCWACRAAWGKTEREMLGNVPCEMFGSEIMGQIGRGGILAPNEGWCWDNSFRALKEKKKLWDLAIGEELRLLLKTQE